MPVFSTDTLVCYEAGGTSIPRLVAAEGWRAFRQREMEVLQKLSGMQQVLIDCGGGIVVDLPETESTESTEEIFSDRKVNLLKSSARVVYVKRDRDWLLDRVKGDPSRPSLSGTRAYEAILDRRLPWYEAAADFILDMRDLSVEEAIGVLLHELPFLKHRDALSA